MGMVLHAMSDNVGNLIESAIILFVERMQNTPLDRFQAILQLGDRPVTNDVRSVLDEIFVDQILERIFGQVKCGRILRHRD
jgi:pilus assembly protein TadC